MGDSSATDGGGLVPDTILPISAVEVEEGGEAPNLWRADWIDPPNEKSTSRGKVHGSALNWPNWG
jgi:hypothetical protein